MKSILSLGAVYLDINAYHFPIPDDSYMIEKEILGEDYETVLGGSAVNFAKFCNNLGLSAYFIGKTGEDSVRDLLIKLFEEEGIHTALKSSPDLKTNICVNLVDDKARSIMLHLGNANQSLSREDVLDELHKILDLVDTLYIGGIFKLKSLFLLYPELVKIAKDKNKKIILDHGRVPQSVTDKEKEMARNLVESSDIYLPSKDEFLTLWSVSSIDEGLKLFANKSQMVVVKDAENGAFTLEDGKIARIDGFSVKPLNTVGAGDSFNAGFIAANERGQSLRDSIRFANATAALKISTNKFPSSQDIEDFFSKQHGDFQL